MRRCSAFTLVGLLALAVQARAEAGVADTFVVSGLADPSLPVQYSLAIDMTAVTDSVPDLYTPEASFARASVVHTYARSSVDDMPRKRAVTRFPEPHRWATLLTALGLVALALRRRINR